MAFSDQVRQALRDTHLSLRQMEAKTGVSRGTLSRFLSGEERKRGPKAIDLYTLDRLAPILVLAVRARRRKKH